MLNRLLPRRRVSSLHKAVFITGCDTGFGHQLAKRLDSKGFRVFAGCLFPDRADAKKLQESTSSRLIIVDLDVTNDESVNKALRTVEENLGNDKLWAIVNNAGILVRGEAEWILLEDYKKQFEVNTYGVVRVTQAFLPLLRKFKGRVVTTVSYSGRFTLTGQVPYCMTKTATCAFCDGLRMEMKKWDVKVVSVEPFCFKTPMTDVQSVVDSVDKTWSKAPAHVKEAYGEGYVEECKKSHAHFYEFASCDNTEIVIDCLDEAVTAYSPHHSYTPGDLKSTVAFWFLTRLPDTLATMIVMRIITFDNYTTAYVKNKNQKNICNGKET